MVITAVWIPQEAQLRTVVAGVVQDRFVNASVKLIIQININCTLKLKPAKSEFEHMILK